MRIAVLHYGLRNVGAFPSCPARPQAEVGVFAIQEKAFLKKSDLLEHFTAVERGRAAWAQCVAAAVELIRRLAVAALLAGAVGRDEHARRIEHSQTRQAYLGCAHARPRADVGGRYQR